MTIKEFIEKAIEGGLKSELAYDVLADMERGIFARHHAYCVFALDPLAWQAVGKVEGWRDEFGAWDMQGRPLKVPEWKYRMLKLTEHLADGGTITSYLKDL